MDCRKNEGEKTPALGIRELEYPYNISQELIEDINEELLRWIGSFPEEGSTIVSTNTLGAPYQTFAIQFPADKLNEALTIFKACIQEEADKTGIISIRLGPTLVEGLSCPRCGYIYMLRARLVS